MIFHFLLIFEVPLLSVWWLRAFLSYTLNCMPFVRKPHCWIYPQSKVSWDIIMLASWLYLLPLSTFWSDEVVLIWVIAVIYVASFLICFVSLSRESCWFVYLSVKVDLSFDWPSHSLTLDPSLCFLPVCASLGHAPRGILRCVSDHWLVVIFSSHSFLLFMIFAWI